MNASCVQQFLACTGGASAASAATDWTPIIIGTSTAVLAIWQYLLKLPTFQRALGAENTEKREKLNAIHAAVNTPPPSPSETTPLKQSIN